MESLTQRNQTHDFEPFARKLCERAICPNLGPQTGPEGGGDSKVDSETYPVADEIALTYIGEPNGARERWVFAFSAKAKWQEKVRADVKGIAETGRPYDRIICVTSRSAKAKDRARIEDQLSKQYGWRSTQESRELFHRSDVGFLRVGREMADVHALDNPLSKRANWSIDHGVLLSQRGC